MDKWAPKTQPWIVCAAIRKGDTIICGPRHFDSIMVGQISLLDDFNYWGPADQGFVDQWGRFYDREEAMQLARQNDQIITYDNMLSETALHSEDLY